jgi:hypothetical protein
MKKPIVTKPGKSRPGKSRPGKSRPGKSRPGKSRPGKSRPGKSRPGKSRPGSKYVEAIPENILNLKQETFCRLYVSNEYLGNGTQAYMASYP